MPRVTCSSCSRELDFSGPDRPNFCAYCGRALDSTLVASASPSQPPTATEIFHPTEPGQETLDYTPMPRRRDHRKVPERVKGYRLVRQIGRGGMGTVYEAEDADQNRKVALKLIAPGHVDSPAAVERFRQEGRLASNLSHPRCVFVLEADEDEDGRPFIAMELMTGDTLQDLVEKHGPMSVGDAVARILDVIDGLIEAHRTGLIHRDVKPSNCFLDGENRVKVGDFGLSKSLAGSTQITRSGTFLGTPLYASPEQIKVEHLDGRTDVYSTAATLFYLLGGRAPFDRGDAAATMARIVTDPAPSIRQLRPEVPSGLDQAIRKGLERDRDRRFRSLEEFREVLLPFLPGHVSVANVGLRIGAYLFDYFLLTILLSVLFKFPVAGWVRLILGLGSTLLYYVVSEGLWRASPGKRLLGLRVVGQDGQDVIGLRRAFYRSVICLGLADLPIDILWYLDTDELGDLICFLAEVAGLALISYRIRKSPENQGLHDALTLTRVVRVPRLRKRREAFLRRAMGRDRGSSLRPVGVMRNVGPYKVRGAIRWDTNRRVVTGEDSGLGREAWIVIRPRGSEAPPAARREIARSTRPRWLAGGEQQEGRWDAYIAPSGCPLADLAGPEGLSWHDARPILEDLADELILSCVEGTLPQGLTVDQVWVQPDGRAILVDPLALTEETSTERLDDNARAIDLLRKAAIVVLEGGRHRFDQPSNTVRAPIPIHAHEILSKLMGGPNPYARISEFREALETTRHHATEVSLGQKATALGVSALLMSIGLLIMYGLTYLYLIGIDYLAMRSEASLASNRWLRSGLMIAIAFFPLVWTFWSAATRGGFGLKFAGLGMVRDDGLLAPRWRCGLRTFLAWGSVALLLIASMVARHENPVQPWSAWVLFVLALVLPIAYSAGSLLVSSPLLLDRLSRLRIVPR